MMQEYLAENARLRQLSRRYAAGEIDLADYREARRAILVALEAGITEAQAVDLERRHAQVEPTDTLPNQLPAEEHSDITMFAPAINPAAQHRDHEPVAIATPNDHEAEDAGAEPAPTLPGAPMDRHSIALLVVLVVALVIALGMLAYVLLL